jgi:hypothetical protein
MYDKHFQPNVELAYDINIPTHRRIAASERATDAAAAHSEELSPTSTWNWPPCSRWHQCCTWTDDPPPPAVSSSTWNKNYQHRVFYRWSYGTAKSNPSGIITLRRGAHKSLARPTSQCRRTEPIVSLNEKRGLCMCPNCKSLSCFRDWKEACQATHAISTTSRH